MRISTDSTLACVAFAITALGLAAVDGCKTRAQTAAVPTTVRSQAFLNMPATADAPLPRQLSKVGAFSDLRTLSPAAGLQAYDVNVPFWSDGSQKRRWISLPPSANITFSADGEWYFPPGTVFVKHFEMPPHDAGGIAQRIETRILVRDARGGVYGATYRWRDDGSDADLVDEPATVELAGGQRYDLPGRRDCVTCHTPASGGVLGVTARQLNRTLAGSSDNQIVAWQQAGYFGGDVTPIDPDSLPRLPQLSDASISVADRARAYLDANCANCHRPGGAPGGFDARFQTPVAKQNLIDGPVMINLGLDHARVIAPADSWRSIALVRVETPDRTRMPPLGHETFDRQGDALLRQWIASLPGTPVLAPPNISPHGGEFQRSISVTLSDADNSAAIHYTLDGSLPTKTSPVYNGVLYLTEPTTVRARAMKEGVKASVGAVETFIVDP